MSLNYSFFKKSCGVIPCFLTGMNAFSSSLLDHVTLKLLSSYAHILSTNWAVAGGGGIAAGGGMLCSD